MRKLNKKLINQALKDIKDNTEENDNLTLLKQLNYIFD